METKSIDALKEDLKDHFWFVYKNERNPVFNISIADFSSRLQWDLNLLSINEQVSPLLRDALDQLSKSRNNVGFYNSYIEPVDIFLTNYSVTPGSDYILVTISEQAKYFFDNLHESIPVKDGQDPK